MCVFAKEKTAYGLRISAGSSYGCSSDLRPSISAALDMTLMFADRAGIDSGCLVAVVAVRPAGARSLLRAPDVACVRRVDGDQRSGLDVRRHHRLDAVLEDRRLVRRRCRLALDDGIRLDDAKVDRLRPRPAETGRAHVCTPVTNA